MLKLLHGAQRLGNCDAGWLKNSRKTVTVVYMINSLGSVLLFLIDIRYCCTATKNFVIYVIHDSPLLISEWIIHLWQHEVSHLLRAILLNQRGLMNVLKIG